MPVSINRFLSGRIYTLRITIFVKMSCLMKQPCLLVNQRASGLCSIKLSDWKFVQLTTFPILLKCCYLSSTCWKDHLSSAYISRNRILPQKSTCSSTTRDWLRWESVSYISTIWSWHLWLTYLFILGQWVILSMGVRNPEFRHQEIHENASVH